MVYEQFDEQRQEYAGYDEGSLSEGARTYGATGSAHAWSLAGGGGPLEARAQRRASAASIQVPAYEKRPAFMRDGSDGGSDGGADWSSIAEATMPLKTSEYLRAASRRGRQGAAQGGGGGDSPTAHLLFQASLQGRSREISRKLIWVNVISLLINLALAAIAFYFSFVNNSSSASAFAADCVLDFISSAIVLWRYHGDLDAVYMQAREQIACVYLGALFEISALAIIIKATSDIASESSPEVGAVGYDLVYLAVAGTLALTILTAFKCSLYRTIRDKSILLDVINSLISTIFAMSIIMSQLLINVDASFWYLDPILSIVLALLMAGFGLKVISQNVNILCPSNNCSSAPGMAGCALWPCGSSNNNKNGHNKSAYSSPLTFASHPASRPNNAGNFEANLQHSIGQGRAGGATNWQKSDYSSIAFV